MRIYVLALLLIVATSCHKQSEPDQEKGLAAEWLEQRKQALANCTCVTAIYQGTYHSEKIYEIRVIDPLCNGVNQVYKEDGTPLLSSFNQNQYRDYLDDVKNLQMIWKCA